ncbi:MAG: choice-of-anchor Q domain-containing protein [Deltaproteobacteria bacterium]
MTEVLAKEGIPQIGKQLLGKGVETVAMKSMYVALVCMGLVGAACGSKTNPNVCCTDSANCAAEGLPDDAQCTGGLICRGNQCIAETCSTSNECEAGAPFCSSDGLCAMTCESDAECPGHGGDATHAFCSSGACVQCRDSTDCGAAQPFCSTGTCRGCETDDECSSGVCGLGGACASTDAIIYLDPAGVDGGQCTATAPCKTLHFGLSIVSSLRQIISMHTGTYTESPMSLSTTDTTAALIDIHGHNSKVNVSYGDNYNYQFGINIAIRDLAINATNGGGSVLNLVAQSAACTLENVELSGPPNSVTESSSSEGAGIRLAGALTAHNLRIHDVGVGIGDEGAMTVDRVVIYDTSAGITVGQSQQANIQATNVLLYDSLNTAFVVGSGIGTFSFSTIASSISATGTQPSAASCNNSGVAITSSILWSPGTHPVQLNCNTSISIAGPPGPDPQFVNSSAKNFHLSLGSPAIDMAATGPAYDIDGDPRPQGARFDYGADEYKP